MSAAANKKLVQQVYEDSANRSGTTFADNLADDASWIVTGQYSWSHEFRGREAIHERADGPFPLVLRGAAAHRGVQLHRRGDYVVVEARGDNVTKAGCATTTILHGVPDRERKDQVFCELVERVRGCGADAGAELRTSGDANGSITRGSRRASVRAPVVLQDPFVGGTQRRRQLAV